MNSVLQILFYIRPLRRLVFDYKGTNNILKVLRDIFVDLMDRDTGYSRKSVEAEALIQAYGRFAERPLRQQDIHEFVLGFLEELENECP
jgi:ubiquitin C-terminal hydrolase